MLQAREYCLRSALAYRELVYDDYWVAGKGCSFLGCTALLPQRLLLLPGRTPGHPRCEAGWLSLFAARILSFAATL